MVVQSGALCKWANDSHRFLLEYFDIIHDSPSHIYHSALPLSPSLAWFHKFYSTESKQKVKVVRGITVGWGICSHTVSLGSKILSLAYWNKTIAVGTGSWDIIILDAATGSQTTVVFTSDCYDHSLITTKTLQKPQIHI